MRCMTRVPLVVGATLVLIFQPQDLRAQACKDEEGMVTEWKKTLGDLVATVKKESLTDFEKAFHQKSSLNKLTFYGSSVEGVLACLDKASQDPATPKEEADAYKAKRANYAKLKEKLQQDRNALKAAEAPKEAKELIAKFDLAD
jgi:SUMO ligase MMS21 Smc5/6 complex component